MRKFTLFLMSLFLAVGAMAQITANTATYTIKSVNRGYIYYDYPTQSLFSSSFQSIVNTAPSGELNEQFAFLRTDNTADGEYYMYCVAAEKFVTYSGSGVALDLTESPSCTWSLDADGSYWLIKVPGTQKTYINITNWEAVNGCKVTSTDPDDGNKMTLEEVANNLDLSEAIAKIETFEAPPAREDYVHNTGNINRGDRGLTSFTITDGENSLTVNSIQTSAQAPVYVDKSAQKLTTKQGATLKFTDFNYTGAWMHAYAYVDYNKDYYFELTNNNDGTTEGEIVSYNYYNGNTITGTAGSQSDAMTSEHNGSKTLPAFTLPSDLEPGEYRMRIKVDWNNLDADKGASDIAANGGCQCDITLVVIPAPYTLNVTSAGWATLYLDFPATIPAFVGEDAGAYIVKEEGIQNGYITLDNVTGVLPANTGIIIKANEGEYEFAYSATSTADVTGNLLQGTTITDVIVKEDGKEYYVLSNSNTGVGLYVAGNGGDNTAFRNWANKAYLVLPKQEGKNAAYYSFRFGEGTTGIEEVKTENGEVKAIYDLTGRRVEVITAPGIYIINGKKTLVK